jgi:xylulokinase
MARFAETEVFCRTVGFVGLSGGFAVAKWGWFRANQPEVWKSVGRIMTMADYFTFALTGERVGDASTAALLGLYDLAKRGWWNEALRVCQVEEDKLSVPLSPGSPCGRTVARATALLGLPAGIPFAVGGLDHQVAALGSGLGRFADMSISTGTVLAAMALVDEVVPFRGCYHGPNFGGRGFFRLAFDPLGAGQLEDYQRRFAPGLTIEQLIALAARVPAGAKPAPDSGGARSDYEHGVGMRSLLESIAVTHRVLGQRVAGAGKVTRIVATGGGARSAVWLQIKADILGVPIVTPTCPERACLGAALLAGVAAGVFKDLTEASDQMVHEAICFNPGSHDGKMSMGRESQ